MMASDIAHAPQEGTRGPKEDVGWDLIGAPGGHLCLGISSHEASPQLRAARALVGWSRDDLAKKSATSAETVKGFEGRGTDPKMGTVYKWRHTLEAAGVEFIDPADGKGSGVRLKKDERGKR